MSTAVDATTVSTAVDATTVSTEVDATTVSTAVDVTNVSAALDVTTAAATAWPEQVTRLRPVTSDVTGRARVVRGTERRTGRPGSLKPR